MCKSTSGVRKKKERENQVLLSQHLRRRLLSVFLPRQPLIFSSSRRSLFALSLSASKGCRFTLRPLFPVALCALSRLRREEEALPPSSSTRDRAETDQREQARGVKTKSPHSFLLLYRRERRREQRLRNFRGNKKHAARRLHPALQGALVAAAAAVDSRRKHQQHPRNGHGGAGRRVFLPEEELARCGGGGNASCSFGVVVGCSFFASSFVVVVDFFFIRPRRAHLRARFRRRFRRSCSCSDHLAALLHHRRQRPDRRRADAGARQGARRGVDRRVGPACGGRGGQGDARRARRGRSVRGLRCHGPRGTE